MDREVADDHRARADGLPPGVETGGEEGPPRLRDGLAAMPSDVVAHGHFSTHSSGIGDTGMVWPSATGTPPREDEPRDDREGR